VRGEYLVTLGGDYDEPEAYAVATDETLEQTVRNAAKDNLEAPTNVRVWKMTPVRVVVQTVEVNEIHVALGMDPTPPVKPRKAGVR
jgi:hypothetical protein